MIPADNLKAWLLDVAETQGMEAFDGWIERLCKIGWETNIAKLLINSSDVPMELRQEAFNILSDSECGNAHCTP